MAEGRAVHGDAQFIGVRPFQLHRLSRLAHLAKMDFARRPVLSPPLTDPTLERAEGVARSQRGIGAKQVLEQRLRLQFRTGLQPRLGLDRSQSAAKGSGQLRQ